MSLVDILKIIAVVVIGYLLGNISGAFLIGKARKIDIREHGSGNAGATNVFRILGLKYGIIVLIIDTGKAALAVLLGKVITGTDYGFIAAGLAVILGHNWPVFLGFKGGKGVAATLGTYIMLDWISGLIMLLIGILLNVTIKVYSIVSMLCSTIFAIVYTVLNPHNALLIVFAWLTVLLILFTHRENIIRLYEGREKIIDTAKLFKDATKARLKARVQKRKMKRMAKKQEKMK